MAVTPSCGHRRGSTRGGCIVRRHLTVLLTAVATLAFAFAVPAAAVHGREPTDRIAGEDRIDTAAAIAQRTFTGGATSAVLASANDFPDALAGSSLAGGIGAPVVLSWRDHLPQRTGQVLRDLGVQRVTILGGSDAIGAAVETQLREGGYRTERVAGQTRYETAADIARQLADRHGVGTIHDQRTVFVAYGGDFPDALTVGPGAYANRNPILLSTTDDLHPAAAAALRDVGAQLAVLVGGEAVLSEQVAARIRELGIDTDRLGGRDRTDTAQLIATYLEQHLGFTAERILLSRGDTFPDALAAAPHGGILGAPILLTRGPDSVSYDLLQWIVDRADTIQEVRALGGPAALTDRVLLRLAEVAFPPIQTLRYTVGVRDQHGPVHADPGFFAEHADWTLVDQRGWALDNDFRYTRVPQGEPATFHLWLASPQDVAAASPGCSADWSCRVGDDVYINDDRWRNATATYDERSLDDYRHYVVLHEVGHWLNLDHFECAAHQDPGEPAPVMDQQSIDTGACTTNVWPLPFERDRARDNIATGGPGATDVPVHPE